MPSILLRDALPNVHRSGRLPYTIAKSESDYPAQIDTDFSLGIIDIPYSEGLNVDYRHFDSVGQEPCVIFVYF